MNLSYCNLWNFYENSTMGDLIELTTRAKHQLRFYKITSGAIAFSVKRERQFRHVLSAERRAAVGLARKPGETCDYWIVMKQNQCWIEKDGSRVGHVREVPNILTGNEYNKFWISWHKGRLQFGCTSDGIPLISKRMLTQNIQYVTFTIFGDRGTMEWKLFLPPNFEKPVLKDVTGGKLKWVESEQNGQLPEEALIGGYEKEILYIIRAPHERSLLPGKYVPSHRLGYVSWNNMPEKKKFEVLCGYNCIWIPASTRIPLGAVEGGYDDYNQEILYIGRAFLEGNLIPGKVQRTQSACIVPYKMGDIPVYEYEILVNPLMYSNCGLPLTPHISSIQNIGQHNLLLDDQIQDENSSDSEV